MWPFTINGSDAGISPNLNWPGTGSGGPAFTLYVNKAGNDANACTSLQPCLTLARAMAVQKALPGLNVQQLALVLVGAGKYLENLALPPFAIVSAQDPSGSEVLVGTGVGDAITLDHTAWVGSTSGYSGVSSILTNFYDASFTGPVNIDFTGVTSPGQVILWGVGVAGGITATGDSSGGGFIFMLGQTSADTDITLTGVQSSIAQASFFGTMSVVSTATQAAGVNFIGSTGVTDPTGGDVVVDATAGMAAMALVQGSAVGNTLTLKGALSSYVASAGGIPNTVTRLSGAPAPVLLSPAVGLNSVLPTGSNATSGYVLTADGLGGNTYAAAAGGGITQLTGPVTAGPGSGSQATTITPGSNGQSLVTAGGVAGWGQVPLASMAAPTGTGYAKVSSGAWSAAASSTVPVGDIAVGSADQLLDTNHAGSATEWFTPGGDVVFTSHNFKVTEAQFGAITFGTLGAIQCAAGESQCGLSQATQTSDTATNAVTMAGQSAFAAASTNRTGSNVLIVPGAGSTTNGTPGNPVYNYTAPTGSGSESYFAYQRAGTQYGAMGYISANAGLGFWSGSGGFNTVDAFVDANASNIQVNAPSSGTAFFTIGGVNVNALVQNGSGFQFFDSGSFDLGGCNGCLGMTAATTDPTSNSTTGPTIYTGHSTSMFCSRGTTGTISCLPN